MTAPPPSPQKLQSSLPPPPLADFASVAILLDVDGTLLDIAPKPNEVRVPERLRQNLQCIWQRLGGALAFVSGRSLADIDQIFYPLRLPAVGGHGAEIRTSIDNSTYRQRAAPLDGQLKHLFSQIVQLGPGIIFEDKAYSVALHYRLAPQLGGEVIKSVAHICEQDGCDTVEILPGKSVIEIKPRGFNKGTALRELMTYPPFAGRRPLFIGDDTTDDAAFAVLPDFSGIGFSVGGIVPGASFNFDGPQDVRHWLEQISNAARAEAR
jgi:trehalose 6-phosphate phosphatase